AAPAAAAHQPPACRDRGPAAQAHRGPHRDDLLGGLGTQRTTDRGRARLRRTGRGRETGRRSRRLRPRGTARRCGSPAQGDRGSGAASQVARIAALYATVRFGDAVTDLVSSVQPTAVDASGAAIDGLTVDPAIVQLTVPVLPTATTRTVPVVPALRGAVAAG